jgi:membrane protease YdiL (CAAX protease family)
MEENTGVPKMPLSKTLGVLIGFPIISTLISLLLLNQSLISKLGLDFSNTFRIIVICWYLVQIYLVYRIIRSEGWSWATIGYSLNSRKTLYFILGYLVFAFGLLFFIEYALANSVLDSEKLKSVVGLSPKNTTARVIFIFLALAAGLAEEFVYRGFAIRALISNNINRWLAVLLASIPFLLQHGIKAYQLTWGSWYVAWGLVFGCLFLVRKNLYLNIIIHWLVILSAMVAILQSIKH